MAKLIYAAIASLDGFVEDRSGGFEWAAPDEEVFRFVNELERPIGTYLYGRRMYETMRYWETTEPDPDGPPFIRDFTDIWRGAEKVVYSRTLLTVSSERTRIERDFDPETVRHLVDGADRDVSVGGADLAGQALAAGLVDELCLLMVPVLIGGGKPSLPEHVRLDLRLRELRRFDGGVAFLRYDVSS